jgi:hypothetical protein
MLGFIQNQFGANMQIQKKRRQNSYGGMWGSTINFFQNLGNIFQSPTQGQGKGHHNYGW